MRVVITGGHLSPALAVIEELPKNACILFIGRKYALEGDEAISLEKQACEDLGIPFESIITGRIQRKFTKHTLFSMAKLPIGFFQSLSILKDFKPDAVVLFGGYIAIPVGLAAYLLGIPILLHEQTLEAGMANKILSRFAKKICISWKSSLPFFPKNKTVLTGNPLRKEFFQEPIKKLSFLPDDFGKEEFPCVYVTGGSLGSHVINCLIEEALPTLLHTVKIMHQTGDARQYKDFERLSGVKEKLSEDLKKRYVITKFVMPSEVSSVLRMANLVIARSGINTVTELLYLKKMALLVPLPFGQSQEQKKNALFLQRKGLAEVVDQHVTTSSDLLLIVDRMIKKKQQQANHDQLEDMRLCKTATSNIVKIISSL